MTDQEVKETALSLISGAKENLEKYGDLLPIIFVAAPQTAIFGLQFENTQQKRKVYASVEKLISNTPEVTHVILLNDCFFRKIEEGDDKTLEQAEEHGVSSLPDKQEAIMAVVSGRESKDYIICQHYHREDGKIVWDGEPEVHDAPSDSIDSRLLPPLWKLTPEMKHKLKEAVDAI